ncbi:MAG TPA: glycosyltransferase family 2 protein [Thermoanaerobaculia bacterium]|nr:glycosyltransferase family 2 protein [Thermoanaerobaculia bacterium]
MESPIELSLVIPLYDEAEVVPLLVERVTAALRPIPGRCEVLFVDDGSEDGTAAAIRRAVAAADHGGDGTRLRISILTLSRNFGHQAAITAGLRAASGACVVVMDGDLEDPPELIQELYAAWKEGNPVVVAQRTGRRETLWRRLQFAAFHRVVALLADIPPTANVGVFGLMDRRVAAEIAALPERARFLTGLRAWVGWKPAIVRYQRQARAGGRSKQSLGRLYRMAFDSIFGFSHKPLRLSWLLGLVVSASSFAYAMILLALRLAGINVVRGFTTTAVAILFLGGVQLLMIGILGEYLGRIYDEVKSRPPYIVKEIWTSEGGAASAEHGAGAHPR